jgi:peptidoglycan L-alanyl-D-glutamate endopeptidase CwlK
MGYKFGKTSRRRLDGVHPDLIKVLEHAIARSEIDFCIASGVREEDEQMALYSKGRIRHHQEGEWIVADKNKIATNADGIDKKSAHQRKADGYGHAVDIMCYHSNREIRSKIAWDPDHLSYVAGIIMTSAKELIAREEISNAIKWGNNWDGDGVLKFDQNLIDRPHFQLA